MWALTYLVILDFLGGVSWNLYSGGVLGEWPIFIPGLCMLIGAMGRMDLDSMVTR